MTKRMLIDLWRRLDALPLPLAFRFFAVGLTGVVVNTLVLWLSLGRLGLPRALAASLAVEISICWNFVLNDAWTFGAERQVRPWRARFLAFQGAAAVAGIMNLTLFLLLTTTDSMHYLAANLVAIGAASAVNFVISASWIWRVKAPTPLPSDVDDDGGLRPMKSIVVIPTYNERANIAMLLERILSLGEDYEALVVDDSSPDGTGLIVAELAREEPRIHLLSRPAKMGIASAYVSGFRRALKMGADLICQMDSDFSHDPADLLRLAAAATPGSVVVGSRYVPGGSTPGWPLRRVLVSRGASLAAHLLLGIPVQDGTGGFKCWSRRALAGLPLDSVRSSGFAFQVEMNHLAWRSGFALIEVPIRFEDRKAGRSKASVGVGLEMAAVICRLFLNPARSYAPGLEARLSREP
ncbi:MAG: glycosyltransferase [Dehalococcoidia bacterium]